MECSTAEPPPFFGRNEEELRACAVSHVSTFLDLEASINGEAVPDLEDYRASTPLFTFYFAEDNFFEVPEGVASAVGEGYNFIIAPPPPGEYEITVSGTDTAVPVTFTTTYRVIVEAPQVIEPEASPEATPVT